MKTPIQELIEEYQQMRENGDNDMRTVIHLAKIMLKKEKQLLVDFFDEGREEEYQYHINNIKPIDGEEFYDYKLRKK